MPGPTFILFWDRYLESLFDLQFWHSLRNFLKRRHKLFGSNMLHIENAEQSSFYLIPKFAFPFQVKTSRIIVWGSILTLRIFRKRHNETLQSIFFFISSQSLLAVFFVVVPQVWIPGIQMKARRIMLVLLVK